MLHKMQSILTIPLYRLAEMRVEAETAAIQQSHVTSSQDELDSRPISSEAVIRELHTYLPVDREIPPRFLEKVLELSFHAPEDNRIAKQVCDPMFSLRSAFHTLKIL